MYPTPRYTLDFIILPERMDTQPEEFIEGCLRDREGYLAEFFNSFYRDVCEDPGVSYQKEDFCVTVAEVTKSDRVIYAELPEDRDGGSRYCRAYAFVYKTAETGGISNVSYYSVEASRSGADRIGKMNSAGFHTDFGEVFPTREENIRAIFKLSRGWSLRRNK